MHRACLSELEAVPRSAAHILRGAAHTEGAAHIEPPLSAFFQRARHTPRARRTGFGAQRTPTKGRNHARFPQIACETPQIDK